MANLGAAWRINIYSSIAYARSNECSLNIAIKINRL